MLRELVNISGYFKCYEELLLFRILIIIISFEISKEPHILNMFIVHQNYLNWNIHWIIKFNVKTITYALLFECHNTPTLNEFDDILQSDQ